MPIVVAPMGEILKVIKILTDETTRAHLEGLGISINSEIVVVKTEGGKLVCTVKGSKVVLENDVAVKIFVALV